MSRATLRTLIVFVVVSAIVFTLPAFVTEAFWLTNVMTEDPIDSTKSGIFSTINGIHFAGWSPVTRRNGQKSSNSSTAGVVTTIGLLIRPSANIAATSAYRRQSGRRT